MIGLSYTGFIVPIPNADEYNDFVTNLPLSPSVKRRLSTSSSDLSYMRGAAVRPNKTGVLRRLRSLVDARLRSRRGYAFIPRE